MGMFDYVKLDESWLPKECWLLDNWQTKDFNQQLQTFLITKDWDISIASADSPYDRYVIMKPISGQFCFYTSDGDPNKSIKWYQFIGTIIDGRLVKVETDLTCEDNCAPAFVTRRL